LSDRARHLIHYVIQFPHGIKDTHYKNEDGDLECNNDLFESTFDEDTEERMNDLIQWRIGTVEENPRRHQDAPPPSTTKGRAKMDKKKNRMRNGN
jgi:hypothetical protein